MDFMQQFASGSVVVRNDAGSWVANGTCAALGSRTSWVTAAHCVPEQRDVAIMRGGLSQHGAPIATEVMRHPDLDLAVIRISLEGDTAPTGLEDHFYELPTHGLINGGEFIGCSYAVDEQAAVERIMRGYFQRWFSYQPPRGSSYFAGEMSVPAPGGSSGSVLGYVPFPKEAVAVVTTNHESSIVVDSFEEVQDGDHTYRETIKRIVAFGIALGLWPHREWLTSVL